MKTDWSIKQSRGFALPVVLWIFLILSLLFAGYSYSVRTETALTRQLLDTSRTRAAAEAAVQNAIYRLLSDRESSESVKTDTVYEDNFDGIALQVAIINESGRVDVNRAAAGLLDKLLQEYALSTEQWETVRDSILDWRDADHEARQYGAEDDDYIELGLPYTASDADFVSIDEVSLVNGMTPELFAIIRPMITVYTGSTKINPDLSPEQLSKVLPYAANDDQADRPYLDSITQSDANKATLFTSQVGNTYTIEVQARLDSGVTTRLASVVRLVSDNIKPYKVLSWKEVEKLDFIN